MKNIKFIAGIIVFGSLWGFAECILGSVLRDINLPAGAIMTGIFAIGLMTLSRTTFRQPGMQTGIGLIAGALRLFNPFGGCFICSAIAIMAEGFPSVSAREFYERHARHSETRYAWYLGSGSKSCERG